MKYRMIILLYYSAVQYEVARSQDIRVKSFSSHSQCRAVVR
jgi:hypothetical protein